MVKLGTGSWEQGVGSWELDRDRERELGWDLGAEGTKSSEIPPGRPKIRIWDPNGGSSINMAVFDNDFAISGTTFQNRKMLPSLPATGYRINAFAAGLPSKLRF